MDLIAFIERYPRLYHMAEKDAWPNIKAKGLLSTTAVLDHYKFAGNARAVLEVGHRPEKVTIGEGYGRVVLRDQKPMPPGRLQKGLREGLTPAQWYKLINNKVFLWAEEHRLERLLNARHYRELEHDVLTINSAALMAKHVTRTWVCHMNSGNALPHPQQRGRNTFKRIADYPVKKSGAPEKEVVEVVVDYSIPDIVEFILDVRRMKGKDALYGLPF